MITDIDRSNTILVVQMKNIKLLLIHSSSGAQIGGIREVFGNVDAVGVLEGHSRGVNWAFI